MKTTLTLDPSSLVLPAGFSLVGSFPSSVAAGDLTQVTIQLDAAALGSYSGTLSFTDSDGGSGPFTLELSGNVVVPAPSLSVLNGSAAVADGSGTVDFPAALTGTRGCPCSAGRDPKPCATAWNKQCGAVRNEQGHGRLPKSVRCGNAIGFRVGLALVLPSIGCACFGRSHAGRTGVPLFGTSSADSAVIHKQDSNVCQEERRTS
jgi:hypothetical protein